MKISLYNLSKNQITLAKGLGMLAIVLHNFFHWTNSIGENEFVFKSSHIQGLIDTVANDPLSLINACFTYFGHFGVQIFIFASGYGLVKQFMKREPSSYMVYILPKIIKIYGLILFGLACYFLLLYRINVISVDLYLEFVKSSLLLCNNFSFDTLFFYPYAGPWWYFGFIIQLYLIFPILYYLLDKYKEKGFFILIGFSYLLIYGLYPIFNTLNIPLFANFIGHLPEFILAMGFAMFKEFRLDYKIVLPALLLFVLSNFSQYFFPFSFASATVLILYVCYPIYNNSSKIIQKSLFFIGSISMFMFLINGPLRAYTIRYVYGKDQPDVLLLALEHLLLTIVISFAMSLFYNKLIEPMLDKLTRSIKEN
ncbi:acyltransferase [Dysgonomonas sp. Marseille-P4677]|uniref:acyltransferase family protein n=1 Tax=Dysgonomonas sp. Marseille-P4677 TaxID=2364790 RepID=UPI001912707C|nr:acyltransferase family protein [Dysgonomonas sp. Marseille-P4677]MBK5720224.1 acyltransferase [Dysgonomonas sp. Marseille-P4677]